MNKDILNSIKISSLKYVITILLLTFGNTNYSLFAQPSSDAQGDCQELIQQARELTNNDLPRAKSLLDLAISQCQSQEQSEVLSTEIWRVARSTLVAAQGLEDPCSKRVVSDIAVQLWKGYINWYRDLAPNAKEQLGRRAKIESAVHQLSIAIVTRGKSPLLIGDEVLRCRPHLGGTRELFELLDDYPEEYFNTTTVTFIKEQLWRCPKFEESEPQKDYGVLGNAICGDNEHPCEQSWFSYNEFLSRWVNYQEEIGKPVTGKSRELDRMTNTLACK